MRFTTRLLHDSFQLDKGSGCVTQPLYQSSAFIRMRQIRSDVHAAAGFEKAGLPFH